MQITVTFDSLEEINEFASKVWIGGLDQEKAAPTKKELNETAKKTAEIINRAEAKEEAEEAPKKTEAKKSSPKEEKPQEEAPAKQDEAPKKEAPAAPEASESQVKVLLSEKLKAGKKAEVKELFSKYGVEKLSELIEKHPDKLGEFYKDAEVI